MQLINSGVGVLATLACIAITLAALALALRVWLASRPEIQTRLCLGCQYDLHHNTTGRCPECGKAISAKQQRYLEQQVK